MRTLNHRRGLSLAEVLIAMFVLTIGLLGVLSLFPLGAVRMAQAIKDDRTANHSLNTSANLRWVWKDDALIGGSKLRTMYARDRASYPQPPTKGGDPNNAGEDFLDPFCNAMEDPNYPHNPDRLNAVYTDGDIPPLWKSPLYPAPVTFTSPVTVLRRNDRRPSYPVFVDPIGWNNGTNANTPMQYWVGGGTNQTTHQTNYDTIPRRSLRRIQWAKDNLNYYTVDPDAIYPGLKQILRNRYFVLLEDMGFGRDGTPMNADGNFTANTLPLANMIQQVQRDGRYSCALLFRRPQNNNRGTMDMSVVVYSGRGTDSPSPENVFTTRFIRGSTDATVYYDAVNGPRPNIRKNSWILDGTMVWQQNGQYVPDNVYHPDHGRFYRVISVTENVAGQLSLELADPAESDTFYNDVNQTPYGLGVVMDNVVEVFPAKSVSPFTRPAP